MDSERNEEETMTKQDAEKRLQKLTKVLAGLVFYGSIGIVILAVVVATAGVSLIIIIPAAIFLCVSLLGSAAEALGEEEKHCELLRALEKEEKNG